MPLFKTEPAPKIFILPGTKKIVFEVKLILIPLSVTSVCALALVIIERKKVYSNKKARLFFIFYFSTTLNCSNALPVALHIYIFCKFF